MPCDPANSELRKDPPLDGFGLPPCLLWQSRPGPEAGRDIDVKVHGACIILVRAHFEDFDEGVLVHSGSKTLLRLFSRPFWGLT